MTSSTFEIIHRIYNWQTLFGSALGSFVAMLVPIFGYLFIKKSEKREMQKESLRKIEIKATMMLEDVWQTQREIRKACELINGRIDDIKKETNSNAYHLGACNFPISGEIFRDHELALLKTGSNYLHNKLLVIDARIKSFNKQLAIARDDFAELKTLNQWLVTVEKNPSNQRRAYSENLQGFSDMLRIFLIQWIPVMTKLLMQVKIYNEMLMIDCKGTRKRFENKKVIKDELKRIENIDKYLDDEVNKKIQEAEHDMKEREKLILKDLAASLKS